MSALLPSIRNVMRLKRSRATSPRVDRARESVLSSVSLIIRGNCFSSARKNPGCFGTPSRHQPVTSKGLQPAEDGSKIHKNREAYEKRISTREKCVSVRKMLPDFRHSGASQSSQTRSRTGKLSNKKTRRRRAGKREEIMPRAILSLRKMRCALSNREPSLNPHER